MSTIFKDIIDKKINADIVYETDDILAFKDINSVAPYHLLIIPKQEIPTVNDVKDSDAMILGKMILAARNIAKKLNVSKSGYRLIINCNDDAGQTVYHLHMHFIAGRKFIWPPG